MSAVSAQRVGDSAWLVLVDDIPIPATYYENNHGHLFTFPSENGVEVQAGLDEDGTWLVSAEGDMHEPWRPYLFKDGVLYEIDPSRVSDGDRMALSLFAHTILHATNGNDLLAACRKLAEAPVRPLVAMFEASTTSSPSAALDGDQNSDGKGIER